MATDPNNDPWADFDLDAFQNKLHQAAQEQEQWSREEEREANLGWMMTNFRDYTRTRDRCAQLRSDLMAQGLRPTSPLKFSRPDHAFSLAHPCTFTLDDKIFRAAEQALHYLKAELCLDDVAMEALLTSTSLADWRKASQQITHFYSPAMDSIWVDWLTRVNKAKFSENEDLRQELLATGSALLQDRDYEDHYAASTLEDHFPVDLEENPNWYDFTTRQNANGWVLMALREQFRSGDA